MYVPKAQNIVIAIFCVNANTLNYRGNFVAMNMFSMCQDIIVPKVFFCG